MNEVKLYGKAMFAWLISCYVFIFLVSIILTPSLIPNKMISFNSYELIVMILSYIGAFYVFKTIISKNVKLEISHNKLNIKYVIIYSIIIMSIGFIGDYIVKFLNDIFKSFGFYFIETNVTDIFSYNNTYEFIIVFIYACVVAPILEELLFRGYAINLFKKYGKKTAILISACMFGITHAEFMQILPAIFCGIVLGILYIKTNDIKVCIACHMINNIFGIINNYYINLVIIIISILLIIFLGRKENLFRVRKDIKKDKFEIKYIFSSIPLMLFILVCIIISLSQLRLV